MSLYFENYEGDSKVVSLAFDDNASKELEKEDLGYIGFRDSQVFLFPERKELFPSNETLAYLGQCNNFDVFLIDPDGRTFRCYDDSSMENTLFITATCNSNCLMCPMPESIRRAGESYSIECLLNIARHIPDDTAHLTITGGEPFMAGAGIFELFSFLKTKFCRTEFLLLTNGRAFAIDAFAEQAIATLPSNILVGIPLHGSSAELHDAITQVPGSFEQTVLGLHRLLSHQIQVELRIVVSKLNVDDFFAISDMIVQDFPEVGHISVMAAEMTGSAFHNKESVWIPYHEAFLKIERGIYHLLQNGLDVRLYNFPLCTVGEQFRTLCEKSISPEKVRYLSECTACSLHDACGGVFAGSLQLEKHELRPV